MDRNTLIRLVALCNLLGQALEELGSEDLSGSVALSELREITGRAAEELNQLGASAGL